MFQITELGSANFTSPLKRFNELFINNEDRLLIENTSIELAGPREKLYFEPSRTRAAIVTAGGLCPGLNNVIRGIVLALHYRYGVSDVLGIRYGYDGFINKDFIPLKLNTDLVDDIHMVTGTILGSSRGLHESSKILERIMAERINILFCIGGDGTLRAARELALTAMKKGYPLSVVGLPKTIDNDISYISRSFGFETAVQEATTAIKSAHTEAKGYYNGIGLVKLMGRYSGFIATYTALAINDANFVLIPEIDFDLGGSNGFLFHLFERLKRRNHAVIIVAEGAGQKFFDSTKLGYDASGNKKLGDIGVLLKNEIASYSEKMGIPAQIKYIDPSYMIRNTLTVAGDSVYCLQLAQNAVHAGMTGKTNLLIGHLHEQFIHLPIDTAVSKRKVVDPQSSIWRSVLDATGQPSLMKN